MKNIKVMIYDKIYEKLWFIKYLWKNIKVMIYDKIYKTYD
jgi:hypothetical protein